MLGYENIAQLSNSDYLIGTTDGYYIMNINDLSFKSHVVSMNTTNTLNGTDASQSIENGSFNMMIITLALVIPFQV
jgi:hypothetical protein